MSDNGLHDIARALREIAGVLRERQVEAPKAGTASPPAAPSRPEWVRVLARPQRYTCLRVGGVYRVDGWNMDHPAIRCDDDQHSAYFLAPGEWEPCSAPSGSVVRSTESDTPESPRGDMAQGTREATPDAALREAAEVVVAREREISWDEEPESLTAAIRALRAALGGAK